MTNFKMTTEDYLQILNGFETEIQRGQMHEEEMTLEQAMKILNIMIDFGHDGQRIQQLPKSEFDSIVSQIGEMQYFFYMNGMLLEEAQSMALEALWHERQFLGV